MIANCDNDRFQNGAEEYARYLETPEGRLRIDLSFANLQEFLPHPRRPLRALDIGCGTGAIAVLLAQLGFQVTILDSSMSMLDYAKRAAQQAALMDRIAVKHGEASQLAGLFESETFDVIVCHNLLEYAEDPAAVLRAAVCILRDSSSVISIMVRNQAGDAMRCAIQAGDLVAAENSLGAQWGKESLYGGRVRLFTPDGLRTMLNVASLTVIAERGVRVVSDYLPPQVCRTNEYGRILELERKLGARPDFAAVARYIQFVAHREDS